MALSDAREQNAQSARTEIERLAAALVEARLAGGISRREAARRGGVGRQSLERLEDGEVSCGLDIAARAAIVGGQRLVLQPLRALHRRTVPSAPRLPRPATVTWQPSADTAGAADWLVRLAGEEIRVFRRTAGRSASAVAVDAGFAAPESLWRWERGQSPSLRIATCVALSLGFRFTLEPLGARWRARPWDHASRAAGSSPAQIRAARRLGRRAATRTSLRQDWGTPGPLAEELASRWGPWSLDAAASPANAQAASWLGPAHPVWARRDALRFQHWADVAALDGAGPVFANFPHSTVGARTADWYRRARATARAGRTVVAVLPFRADSRAFHRYIWGHASVYPCEGRLHYEVPGAAGPAPFPSVVVVWHGLPADDD